MKARLRKDQGTSAAERRIGAKDVVNVFKDYKVFIGGFMYFGLVRTYLPREEMKTLTENPKDRPGLRLCLFRARHHQILRLLSDPDAAA